MKREKKEEQDKKSVQKILWACFDPDTWEPDAYEARDLFLELAFNYKKDDPNFATGYVDTTRAKVSLFRFSSLSLP